METSSNETTSETAHSFSGFRFNKFEGPMALLWFLIEKNEINIYDIPIAQITEQFLDYLASAPMLDLDEMSEFHTEAAGLLLLKSRMLLPIELSGDDEDEDPRQELVERLIEYQKYKKLSALMEEKEKEAEWVIERKRLQRPLPFDDDGLWERVDVLDLLKFFTKYTSGLSRERIIDLYEEVTVNEKVALLHEIFERKGECFFPDDLVVRSGSILDFICAFLAILEMAKQRRILIFQNRMFGDIKVLPRGEELNDGFGIGERNGLD